ncbi:MSHA biogenesis protein, MshO [Teredinibacter turnerae T7901]|uniref:MSHA biogenesis protein, MshO n=2 Tax=Teredinibacter turnerae TaxID=2426 RepID=C5BR32_TERTT|nr:MSHA biogenesis protein, MshO [Teredinibacter turnerae T7901]
MVMRRRIIQRDYGFTLVELIAVIVIIAIVAGIGTSFVVSSVNTYKKMEIREKLVARGRASVEQMVRQIRIAAPNTTRVSASGNCVEFMPLVAGVAYYDELPDQANGAPAISAISTSSLNAGLGTMVYVLVGSLSSAEVYSNAGVRVGLASVVAGGGGSTINLSGATRFLRNSPQHRLYIADAPKRFCIIGTDLAEYRNYTFTTSALTDAMPADATRVLLADNVAAGVRAFSLSSGGVDRNVALLIDLVFSERGEQVALNQEVLIRNVP